MADLIVTVGKRSAQGRRPNNEDRLVADEQTHLFLVADGMGGQEYGERASGMAADIIPKVVQQHLAAHDDPGHAIKDALAQANQAIIQAGQQQTAGRRMGTTAVLALQQANQVFVAGLGDSRAYLVRGQRVEQLTMDHTVADALERNGALTAEQAAASPWKHVLYKFLGCVEMTEGADVRPFTPQAGDRLILASDGLTNHVTEEDLRDGVGKFPHPQTWANHLVEVALARGSKDNVTCIVVAFDKE